VRDDLDFEYPFGKYILTGCSTPVDKHYRDNAGLECDAVVHFEDGRWGICGTYQSVEAMKRSVATNRE